MAGHCLGGVGDLHTDPVPVVFLPGVLRPFYYSLFRFWCRSFARALGVDLRLHQKNTRALPKHYILIANHPSAFEDIGIPALFPVHSLAKIEVRRLVAGRAHQLRIRHVICPP